MARNKGLKVSGPIGQESHLYSLPKIMVGTRCCCSHAWSLESMHQTKRTLPERSAALCGVVGLLLGTSASGSISAMGAPTLVVD